MNDTPETDKATIASGGDWCPVLRETSRRLERERDEWAAMCGRYKQERDEAMAKYDTLVMENMLEVNKLCTERDEAIEKHRFAVMHWQRDVFKMQRERDEALEELRKLKIILDVIKNETL